MKFLTLTAQIINCLSVLIAHEADDKIAQLSTKERNAVLGVVNEALGLAGDMLELLVEFGDKVDAGLS